MSQFSLIRTVSDGISLQGISDSLEKSDVAIHLHGSWGNFYENSIATAFQDIYNDQGYKYAAVNDRSHDFGTVHEVLDESVRDIGAWIDCLAGREGRVIIQCHSLAALKVLKFMTDSEFSQRWAEQIDAIIMLSPFDLVGFYGGRSKREIDANRNLVASTSREESRQLVADSVFSLWPISAGTYLRATEQDSPWDLFPSRNGVGLNAAGIACPILALVGTNDFAAVPSPDAALAALKTSSGDIDSIAVAGGIHNFAGSEDQVGQLISAFLRRILKNA